MRQMVYSNERSMAVLDIGMLLGYDYVVKSFGTHPCAYVKIPRGYPIHTMEFFEQNINVHGGITFYTDGGIYINELGEQLDGCWIGWDYAHAGDFVGFFDRPGKRWTTREIVGHCRSVIQQLDMLAYKAGREA